jgi:hypothetical protein
LLIAAGTACAGSRPPVGAGSGRSIYGPYSSTLFGHAAGHWPLRMQATGAGAVGTTASNSAPCDPISSTAGPAAPAISSAFGPASPAVSSTAGPAAPAISSAFGPAGCLVPFPDDYFTIPDPSTATGLRLNFPVAAMPSNAQGTPIDPGPWEVMDGFSPGSQILAHVPGLDAQRTGLAPSTDIGSSLRPGSPVVILDTRTGQEWPYFATLDANDPDASSRLLVVTPAVQLTQGDTFVVALRNMRDSQGRLLPAPAVFLAMLNRPPAASPLAARASSMQPVLAALRRAGISTKGLYLAWDFTVDTQSSIAGPVLAMRKDALEQLGASGRYFAGGRAPNFTVTSVQNPTPSQNRYIERYVSGTFQVPSFLDEPGGPPGSRFEMGPDRLPEQLPGNVQTADFLCALPRSATAGHPASPALYGHGLLGSDGEVHDLGATATGANMAFCGTNWIGMSNMDIPTAVSVLKDFSKFPAIPDRLDQAFIDFIYLGRLMTRTDGFASSPAFQDSTGRPLIDTRAPLSYYGNSQGSVVGGAMVAVDPDIRRAVLGVPGMDFSVLIPRSSDFATFAGVLKSSYPYEPAQVVAENLVQILWDRGETDGYAQFLGSRPLPDTPAKTVLLEAVLGDHQVANVTAEIEARTIGARAHRPAFPPKSSPERIPLWGIPSIPSYPYHGSALFFWDNGTPAPPAGDVVPTAGADPHDFVPRKVPAAQELLAKFLLDGSVTNVCGARACTSPANPTTPE